jgi:hypothetical protein
VSLPGGSAFNLVSAPHIQLDAQGLPTVTWVHGDASYYWVAVHRLEGETWKQLAHVNPVSTGDFLRLERAVSRVTPSGLLKVAWKAQPKSYTGLAEVMFASQETPEGWVFMPYSTSAIGWQELAMDMNDTGVAVTAWYERVDDVRVRLGVQRWSESPMPALTALPTRFDITNPAVVVQRDGNPVVAWGEMGAVLVYRWTGTAWEQLGQPVPTPVTTPAGIAAPVLTVDASGRPLLAWSVPGEAEVWRWAESGWVRWTEISRPTSNSFVPGALSLQVDETGAPVLAWNRRESDDSPYGVLEVFRLNR